MDTSLTLIKATGMSFIIFWSILFSEDHFYLEALPYVILSIIPVALCCVILICLTIAPFFWSKKETTSYREIYCTYFPFYTIALFGISIYALIASKFDNPVIAFTASAFLTLLKSWSWIIKPLKKK